ncbi:hypothetical protein CEXT_504791 [Caerostris extrusa]|uniref:Uncharacterized protein n=1 Tax=Caerostris extrusa TaxID=172846 RepID=A0AAV4TZA0_CAEEX|nr:hypothetical protein CEXT_504791 [Caerostris extrusa]
MTSRTMDSKDLYLSNNKRMPNMASRIALKHLYWNLISKISHVQSDMQNSYWYWVPFEVFDLGAKGCESVVPMALLQSEIQLP